MMLIQEVWSLKLGEYIVVEEIPDSVAPEYIEYILTWWDKCDMVTDADLGNAEQP